MTKAVGRGGLWALTAGGCLVGALMLVPQAGHATFSPVTLSLPKCAQASTTIVTRLTILEGARPLSAAEVRQRKVQAQVTVEGKTTPCTLKDDQNAFDAPIVYGEGRHRTSVRVDVIDNGATVAGVPVDVEVVPLVQLRPVATTDFGEVQGGCQAEAHCRPLDLSGSNGMWPGARLALWRKDAPGSAEGDVEVWVRQGKTATRLSERETMLTWPPASPWQLCVQPRSCRSLPSKPLRLAVRIDDPCIGELRKEACDGRPCPSDTYNEATFMLTANWRANSWWYCYRMWVFSVLALLVVAVIAYGFIRPRRFHRQAALRIATKQTELRRASLRPLRTCIGGRHGFYRSAVVSINDMGLTVRPNQPHVVQLRAGVGHSIDVVVRGQLERLERNAFKPVQVLGGKGARVSLATNCTYRVNGNIYFEVMH